MHKATRLCFYCLHKLWLTLAVLLVLLAVVISILRYSLPYADNYKQHIEQLISNRYGANVSIGELSAGWQRFGPALLLKQVQLFDHQQQLQLSITETRVRLDFWRSLLNRRLTAQHFELNGLVYYLDSSTILATEQDAALDTAPVLDALESLLFKQLAYFSVTDSQLVLQSKQQPDLIVNIKQLDWSNSGNRHQGDGELSLAGVTANTVSFVLDLQGDTLATAAGQLYLQSEKLDVLPWFASVLPTSQKLQHANVNFQAWGQIDGGLLQRIQVELAQNSISWQHDDTTQQLHLGQGQLLWQPTAGGWSLYSGALTLAAGTQQWQDLQLQLHYQQGQWLGSLNNFRLEAATPLAQLLADDVTALRQLVAYQPAGHLQQLQWRIAPEQWQLAGRFAGLQSAPVGDIPGLNNVQGDFLLSNSVSRLTLQGEQGELQWDGLFSAPTPYHQLSATAYLQLHQNAHWRLSIPKLSLSNADLQLDASMQLDQHLQMLVRLQQLDATNAHRYYPQRYMPAQTRDYLSSAIVAGQVSEATMLWQGKPAEFPYADHQGVFQVLAQLEQGQFAFAPEWPQLDNLAVTLWFENAFMQIQSAEGSLHGIALQQGVTAEITDLFDAQTLAIRIARPVQAGDVTALMLASPLQAQLGQTLAHLGVAGEVAAEVELAIGLKQSGVLASGSATFSDASLSLQAPAMQVQQLSGSLSFSNDKISADALQLRWRGLPITAALQGENTPAGYQLALQLQGEQNSQQLLEALHAPAATLVAGNTAWQGQLALSLTGSGVNYQAQLHSDLQHTALLLPAPYSKASDSESDLTLTLTGDSTQSAIALSYSSALPHSSVLQPDSGLHFNAILQHDTQQLSSAHLSLGPEDAGRNKDDFSISVNLSQLDFLAWFDIIQQQLAATDTSADSRLFPALAAIRGKVGQLDLTPGIRLHNTVFDATQQTEHWQLQLNATELASRWQFSKAWQQQGISATLDYLHLPLAEQSAVSPEAGAVVEKLALTAQRWLLQLPPISVSCADCSLGNYRFGQVTAKAHSSADRWQLDSLQARYKRHQLSLQGYWQDDGSAGYSEFSGTLQSANIGAMLDEFQLTSAISGSNAQVQFRLSWPGAPQQYLLDDLSGEVNYALGEGNLTEVSDQGSRLFALFSMDSLLRKLRLDFRDVFAKGFFYNKMSGNIAISQGVAQTSDASVDGVPGNLQIQGYTDLVNNTLDYQMAFSPKVTSSLPVIIAWMVNPATGLAALALDEVFQSAEVISKINFTVTGSFDKPVVTEVNRHSTEVPVPVRVAQPEAVIDLPAPQQPPTNRKQPHG